MTPRLSSVFVYGTLRPPQPGTRPGDSRFFPEIEAYVRFSAPALLTGARLYDLGAYPGARPGAGRVQGDLLVLSPAALPVLDQIEGHPQLFQRDWVVVETEAGPTEAWVYWARADIVADKPAINCGNWFKRPR